MSAYQAHQDGDCKAPPGPDRENFRSATPLGFARAVFDANATQKEAVA